MKTLKLQISQNEYVDYLNIFLILLSLGLAIIIPFELFLVAYAVIGPLHYLTEINWVRSKKFFVADRSWVWFVLIMSLWVSLPKVFFHFADSTHALAPLMSSINAASNAPIYLSAVYVLFLAIKPEGTQKWVFILVSLVLLLILYQEGFFGILFGFLIPTLIHVYLFTLLFMLYGAIKSRSRPGGISVVLLVVAAFSIFLMPSQPAVVGDRIHEILTSSRLHSLNIATAKLLKLDNVVDGVLSWRAQVLIAFAYLYHYLNWFSKTTVIKWHQSINKSRSLIIFFLWLLLISLYAYDYRLGFVITLFLSYVHVMLEFPLNLKTMSFLFNNAS